jgi:hypothetical protein
MGVLNQKQSTLTPLRTAPMSLSLGTGTNLSERKNPPTFQPNELVKHVDSDTFSLSLNQDKKKFPFVPLAMQPTTPAGGGRNNQQSLQRDDFTLNLREKGGYTKKLISFFLYKKKPLSLSVAFKTLAMPLNHNQQNIKEKNLLINIEPNKLILLRTDIA